MFKALNGEEIIAKLIEETETEYTIEKARVLTMQQVQPGKLGLALIPWYLGAPDGTVDVSKAHVFSRLQTIPMQFAKDYLNQTTVIDLI